MARKIKKGLDYFSHDCHYDNELKYIIALHKATGYMVFFELLRKIYGEEGYYMNADKKVVALFANEINVNIEEINVIINDCINEGIFNKKMYNTYKILTSSSIQQRYFEAIKRRKEVEIIEKYKLVDNVNIILENANIILLNVDRSTQSKVKESKVKERKEKKKNFEEGSTEEKVISFWNSQKIILHELDTLSEATKTELCNAIKEAVKETSLEEVLLSIERYSKIIFDTEYFFEYKWTLINFLKRKKGYKTFLDNGEKWSSYIKKAKKHGSDYD